MNRVFSPSKPFGNIWTVERVVALPVVTVAFSQRR